MVDEPVRDEALDLGQDVGERARAWLEVVVHLGLDGHGRWHERQEAFGIVVGGVHPAPTPVLAFEPVVDVGGGGLRRKAAVEPGFGEDETGACDAKRSTDRSLRIWQVMGHVPHRDPVEGAVRELIEALTDRCADVQPRLPAARLAGLGLFDADRRNPGGSARAEQRAAPAAKIEHRLGPRREHSRREAGTEVVGVLVLDLGHSGEGRVPRAACRTSGAGSSVAAAFGAAAIGVSRWPRRATVHEMEPRISCVTLGVRDVSRARAFYLALGWEPAPQSKGDLVYFRLGTLAMALYPESGLVADAQLSGGTTAGFRGVVLSHNTRSLEEVAAVLAAAEGAGGRIVKAAQPTSWGGHGGYFVDPDGHLWEVAFNPKWPLRDDGGLPLD